VPFTDPEAAARAVERIEETTGLSLGLFVERAFDGNAAPDLALTNLERWLRATASPRLHMEQLVAMPGLGHLLMTLMGASQPIADSLIQNPELATLLLEPGIFMRVPTRDQIVAEGSRLLAAATSNSHALDRLRYLKQRWNLQIVLNDLGGTWPQETVWRVLSDLADALIELAYHHAWHEHAKLRDLDIECPVTVVGFGKLGGRELNYSSDVDMVYVLKDGTDERLEREATRFCEAFGRALSDRMGRGSLFRVDLRLRPYGGAGPILRSMASVEAYYNLYAEPWEVQALLRSRAIVGPTDIGDRWSTMIVDKCFRPRLSEIALEEMLAMRVRIEERSGEEDLKRGTGGIRDVEFLTQILQMLNGHAHPELHVAATCDALRALDATGKLDHAVATSLVQGYTFLRKLEHRTQLVGDRQTHAIPNDPAARESLARISGFATYRDLASALDLHRRTIHALYRSTLNLEPGAQAERTEVLRALGPHGPAALQWFDVLPQSEAFYQGLLTNEGSLDRVRRLIAAAPALVPYFKASVPLTELLLSGEIEEEMDAAARVSRLAPDVLPESLAKAYASGYATILTRWVLAPHDGLGEELASLNAATLTALLESVGARFTSIGLGSFATGEAGPGSDVDLVLLVEEGKDHPEAERQAQTLLSKVDALRRLGAPIGIDLRLRPEGRRGLLVRTLEGLRAYDLEGMDLWERFALGHATLVRGNVAALEAVLHAAYAVPLTPDNLRELLKMKRRIETERVQPQQVRRQVKLGSGGLNDIEWLVHLHEMRYPPAEGERTPNMAERIRHLGRRDLLNALEVERLLQAHRHLQEVRARIVLLGIPDDLIPENPDKLDRLAHSCGDADGNAFLARHLAVTDAVRAIYTEGLERLKA
jgi:glutamate-ammonia-ligase adenylyltransferase